MQDRKFLRENSNCFRGCKSSVHPARECQSNIKCTERNSDKHESALHPGQAPWFKPAFGAWREARTHTNFRHYHPVHSNLWSDTFTVENCSKICPAMVYPKVEWDKAPKPCVIIDQQSLAFFDKFNVQSPTASHTLKI